MKRTIFALSLIMLVLGFSSCRQTMFIPPEILFPPESEREWNITINCVDPEKADSVQTIELKESETYSLPTLSAEGFEFQGYITADGTVYQAGDTLTYEYNGIVLTVIWKSIAVVDSSTSLEEALASGADIIELNETFSSTSPVSIPAGRSVTVRGVGEGTEMKALFTLGDGASFVLENIKLTNDITSQNLITVPSGSASVTISDSELNTPSNGDAINVASGAENIDISISDTTINLNPAAGGETYGASNGIRIGDNESTTAIGSVSLSMDNVKILDNGDGATSAMPIDFHYVEQFSVDIQNSEFDIKKAHYIRINNSGNDNTRSNVTMTDTNMTGYMILAINDSQNIEANIDGGSYKSINQLTGSNNNTSMFQLNETSGSSIKVSNATITFGKQSSECAEMQVFKVMGNKTSENSSVSLTDCTLDTDGMTITNRIYIGSVYRTDKGNSATIDSLTANSLEDDVEGLTGNWYLEENTSTIGGGISYQYTKPFGT